MMPLQRHRRSPLNRAEDGFALIGLVVAIFIILLMLSIAAPTVARELRREREVEATNRAKQYLRAIQLYSKKAGGYPASLEQLEKSNNIRYLRQRYNDPMTGKPDWRLIKVGENKTTVKGFFGQPLGGLATTGIGSSATGTGTGLGTSGSTPGASSASAFGSSSGSPSGSAFGTSSGSSFGASSGSSFGSPSTPDAGTMAAGTATGTSTGTSSGSSSTPGLSGIGSQSGTGFSGTGAPFMGVGLPIAGDATITVNEKTTYPEWEFLYDPRIEALKAKVSIFGGGMSSSGASSLGSGNSSGLSTPGTSPTSSTSGFGSTPSSSPSTPSGGTATTPQ